MAEHSISTQKEQQLRVNFHVRWGSPSSLAPLGFIATSLRLTLVHSPLATPSRTPHGQEGPDVTWGLGHVLGPGE